MKMEAKLRLSSNFKPSNALHKALRPKSNLFFIFEYSLNKQLLVIPTNIDKLVHFILKKYN